MLSLVSKSASSKRLAELDDVVLLHAVDADGYSVPEGAAGTIVMVHAGGEAYTVEFSEPGYALALVEAEAVRPIAGATREHVLTLAGKV